jgi:hypothetical protein
MIVWIPPALGADSPGILIERRGHLTLDDGAAIAFPDEWQWSATKAHELVAGRDETPVYARLEDSLLSCKVLLEKSGTPIGPSELGPRWKRMNGSGARTDCYQGRRLSVTVQWLGDIAANHQAVLRLAAAVEAADPPPGR